METQTLCLPHPETRAGPRLGDSRVLEALVSHVRGYDVEVKVEGCLVGKAGRSDHVL